MQFPQEHRRWVRLSRPSPGWPPRPPRRRAGSRTRSSSEGSRTLRTACQARDLHVHAGRAKPARDLRLQPGDHLRRRAVRRRSDVNGNEAQRQGAGAGLRLLRSTARAGCTSPNVFPHLGKHADRHVSAERHGDGYARAPRRRRSLRTAAISLSCGRRWGAWALYGLGTENEDLPGFVTMNPPPVGGSVALWVGIPAGDLPRERALTIEKGKDPIENIRNARQSSEAQRAELDFVQEMNRELLDSLEGGQRDRGRDPVVRAGVPHAVVGAGSDGTSRRRVRRRARCTV